MSTPEAPKPLSPGARALVQFLAEILAADEIKREEATARSAEIGTTREAEQISAAAETSACQTIGTPAAPRRTRPRPQPDLAELPMACSLTLGEILARAHRVDHKPTYGRFPQPGVYFLIDGDHVVYVGSTKNLGQRLSSHASLGRAHTHVAWILVPTAYREAEAHYIALLKPPQNGPAFKGKAKR